MVTQATANGFTPIYVLMHCLTHAAGAKSHVIVADLTRLLQQRSKAINLIYSRERKPHGTEDKTLMTSNLVQR